MHLTRANKIKKESILERTRGVVLLNSSDLVFNTQGVHGLPWIGWS